MKSQFVALVSHELRTPLISIMGSIGILHGGASGEMPENIRNMVEITHSNSERLANLVNDILDFEKLESGNMDMVFKPVILAEAVAHSIELNRPYALDFGITLQTFDIDNPAQVNADRDRIVQVMTNLLSNAAKFSPAESTVTIAMSSTADEAQV